MNGNAASMKRNYNGMKNALSRIYNGQSKMNDLPEMHKCSTNAVCVARDEKCGGNVPTLRTAHAQHAVNERCQIPFSSCPLFATAETTAVPICNVLIRHTRVRRAATRSWVEDETQSEFTRSTTRYVRSAAASTRSSGPRNGAQNGLSC